MKVESSVKGDHVMGYSFDGGLVIYKDAVEVLMGPLLCLTSSYIERSKQSDQGSSVFTNKFECPERMNFEL